MCKNPSSLRTVWCWSNCVGILYFGIDISKTTTLNCLCLNFRKWSSCLRAPRFGYVVIPCTVSQIIFLASTNPYSSSKHNHEVCRNGLFVTYIFLKNKIKKNSKTLSNMRQTTSDYFLATAFSFILFKFDNEGSFKAVSHCGEW